jgi:hypothetical protein
MPSDFANYWSNYGGAEPQVNVPNAPSFTPSPRTRGLSNGGAFQGQFKNDLTNDVGMIDPLTNIFEGKLPFMGSDGPRKIPQGGREFIKGNALLNAYNWLLPYTVQTEARGAAAFGDLNRRESSKSKAYELAQFQDYAPRFADAVLNADPRQARMLELYNNSLSDNQGQAQSYVDRLKGQLDNPMNNAVSRDIMQSSLGQAGVSGFGPQARDAALAYIRTGLQGQQLQNQREQQYMQALGMLGQNTQALAGGINANKSVLGDPFLAFAGRPSQPMGSNPQSPNYSGFNNDLFSYSVNGDIQRANMAAANRASNMGMITGIVGGALGAAGKAFGGV